MSYLEQLKKLEKNFIPNSAVASVLGGKYLVFVVGPAKVGKSTLMNELALQDKRFSRIGGFTTRGPRPDDEASLYRYLPNNEASIVQILAQVKAGELVQYAIHPTTGNVYATELSDYGGQYNCKDVLGHAMAGFRALSSAGSYTFSIICEPKQWLERLYGSYNNKADPDLQKRIAEAKINLQWSLQDDKTIWIDNSNGHLADATIEVLKYCTTTTLPDPAEQTKRRKTAQSMLRNIT